MSLSFKIKNPGKTIQNLINRNEDFEMAVRKHYVLTADRFISDIRERYYSGQKATRGVNKISHNLHNNWFPMVEGTGEGITAYITNTMHYAKYHEYGSSIHKKRTYVTESITKGRGRNMFVQAVKKALKEAF